MFIGTSIHGQFPVSAGKVFFGRLYKTKEEMEKTFVLLREHNVTLIWNLIEIPIAVELESKHFDVLHTPIPDYDVPESEEAFVADLNKICAHLEKGGALFVHCYGGHGRTGIALASLAIYFDRIHPDKSLEMTMEACMGPEADVQAKFVRKLANRIY